MTSQPVKNKVSVPKKKRKPKVKPTKREVIRKAAERRPQGGFCRAYLQCVGNYQSHQTDGRDGA